MPSIVKIFTCEECRAAGKIVLKDEIHEYEDILYCPTCGYNIQDEDDKEEEED
jgi:hypothetical protein